MPIVEPRTITLSIPDCDTAEALWNFLRDVDPENPRVADVLAQMRVELSNIIG
jgi:hypothetical protein